MPYLVSILRLQNDHLYVGSTNDLNRRLAEHRAGSGSKTTSDSSPSELLYSESFHDQQTALRRERQLKGWSRAKKLALANGDPAELKRLAQCRCRSRGVP